MSASSDIDAAALTVLLDLRSPTCYLALDPAIELARELGVEIDWLPSSVPPLKAPSDLAPGDDRGTWHRRHRARAIAREIEVYARARGLVLRDLYRDADAHAFVLGWLWLRERSRERLQAFLRDGFRAYWSLELDPASVPAVAERVASAGDDAAQFTVWCQGEGPAAAKRVADDLRARGLAGAPGYLVEGEFFLGRQHLPMIRWILAGRDGPGPI